MAFRRKMHNGVGSCDAIGNFRGTHVQREEFKARVRQCGAQILQVAGVGKFIDDDNRVVGVFAQPVMHEIRADESRAACNRNAHGYRVPPATLASSVAFAAFSRTKLLALHSDSNVPASVHQPSRIS